MKKKSGYEIEPKEIRIINMVGGILSTITFIIIIILTIIGVFQLCEHGFIHAKGMIIYVIFWVSFAIGLFMAFYTDVYY
jgi:hypothetical protein